MKIKRPEIILSGIQIKSLRKSQLLANALNVIEEECGIHEVKITIKEAFVCPWIKISKLKRTPMEKLLKSLILKCFGGAHFEK